MSEFEVRKSDGVEAKRRLPEADALKAAGIVVIPLIHSLRPIWDGGISPAERWLLLSTRFAVPAFLFVSGYLAAGDSVSFTKVGARLRRLLVPYVVATIVAEAFFALHGRPFRAESAALDLLFGSGLGPYYYVFVAILLTVAWPLFAIAAVRALVALAVLSILSQLAVELGLVHLPIPWVIRNPFLWCAYFLWGWAVRARRQSLVAWIEPRRRFVEPALAGASVTLLAGAAVGPPGPTVYVLAWLNIYVTIALLFALSTRWRETPAPVRSLSDMSYAVYLYHLLVIYALWDPDRGAPASVGAVAALASWALGVAVPSMAALLLRRAFGVRARVYFGA